MTGIGSISHSRRELYFLLCYYTINIIVEDSMGQRVLLIRNGNGEAWSAITLEGAISFHSLVYGKGEQEHSNPDFAVERVRRG